MFLASVLDQVNVKCIHFVIYTGLVNNIEVNF